MTVPPLIPCLSARDYITCKRCRRAHPTNQERHAMAQIQPYAWRPTAYGQCPGLAPREEET